MNLHPIETIQVSLSQLITSFVGAFQRPSKQIERTITKEVKIDHHGFLANEIQIFVKGNILIVEGLKYSKDEQRVCHSFREYSTIESGYNFQAASIKYDVNNLVFTVVKEK